MEEHNKTGSSIKKVIASVPFNELTTHASSIAFFFFLSMIPFFILAFALFPFTGITEAQILELLDLYVPQAAESIFAGIVHQAYSASAGVYSISILFIIWSSSQSMNALTRALNAIDHQEEQKRFFMRLLWNVVNTLIIIALLMYLLFMHGIKKTLLDNIEIVFSNADVIHFFTRTTNYILVFITSVLILALLYTFVPDGKRRYTMQLPGAACASLGWIIFSLLFRIYINGSNIYKSFYGSLAAIAIFLFWLYCCFMIFLVGALINRTLYEQNVKVKIFRKGRKE